MEQPTYVPVVLKSMDEICKAFGVGQPKVREWVESGAPIAVECNVSGTPVRYRSELNRLYFWLEGRKSKNPVKP